MASSFPGVVDLNVGGRHLTTLLSTLTKYPDSMLAAMFSGRQPVIQDKDGRYFIDVDGDVFVHVLNFLRFETMPPPEAAADVRKYADYFGLDVLKEGISNIQDNRDTLYDIWRSNCLSNVTNYTRHWEVVERGLKKLDFSSRSICLTTKLNSCLCGYYTCSLPSSGYSVIDINLSEYDHYRRPSVLNLLAHDVQRLGFFIFGGNIHSNCNSHIGVLLQIK
ncbi:BTB/POZ domain-containing protein KCTD6-like isoform X1 [Haliotis rubra]|uniref:BTB/POZ domain-containing protein KCTD6-like isoform X1 n=1 Tax=Haliotis rubra TaxID=36100 RepID=UPI001EE593A7|nr:BTB/POZ domain-containing protein KCTD6-like isoform X1 [Haliotis rubra]